MSHYLPPTNTENRQEITLQLTNNLLLANIQVSLRVTNFKIGPDLNFAVRFCSIASKQDKIRELR